MRPNKENKPNRGFKRAFRAGIFIIIILSFLISWASVSILRSINGDKKCEMKMVEIPDCPDTVFVERIKEIKIIDTVYRYIYPPKPKVEEFLSPKEDTISK